MFVEFAQKNYSVLGQILVLSIKNLFNHLYGGGAAKETKFSIFTVEGSQYLGCLGYRNVVFSKTEEVGSERVKHQCEVKETAGWGICFGLLRGRHAWISELRDTDVLMSLL